MLEILDKDHTIAAPGFNRWMIPPAALAIHLCIGMAYGFSVFWLPLSQALGITSSIPCSPHMNFFAPLFTTSCDWKISWLTWIFTLFFIFLGSAAAVWGGWVEHAGPRKTAVIAAICWCGGLVISSIGVYWHQLWMLWLGSGAIGGIGLGLGYISPVSTLIKWFPDKRGMATGMAIMGFGGGAMIGAPLADKLMKFYATADSVGVWQTFLTLALIYFVFMLMGAFNYRLPPLGWKPTKWRTKNLNTASMITLHHVHLNMVLKTPQFWLLWWVLCLNVTAGIAILSVASPMLQEIFGGKLLGLNLTFNELSTAQKASIAGIAAGFTGLLSLFNIGGRIFWSALSDVIGRKSTYTTFFVLGVLLYLAAPFSTATHNIFLFVGIFCIVLSMYGGGFATIPAYLADIFGTRMVGAIHGRLLTAWSAAGILGPLIISYLQNYQTVRGIPTNETYNITAYILAGLLLIGLICNLMVRPVNPKFNIKEQVETEYRHAQHELEQDDLKEMSSSGKLEPKPTHPIKLFLAWFIVGLPMLWGIWITLKKALVLFI